MREYDLGGDLRDADHFAIERGLRDPFDTLAYGGVKLIALALLPLAVPGVLATAFWGCWPLWKS